MVADIHTERLLRARFFAVPAGAARDRRPTDVVVLVTALVVVVLFGTRAGEPLSGFEASLSDLAGHLPVFLDPLWQIAYDALAVWAFCVTVVAVVRRQWGLVRDLAVTVVAVVFCVAVVGRWTNDTWPDVVDALFGTDESRRVPRRRPGALGRDRECRLVALEPSVPVPRPVDRDRRRIGRGRARRDHSERVARRGRARSRSCSIRAPLLRFARRTSIDCPRCRRPWPGSAFRRSRSR